MSLQRLLNLQIWTQTLDGSIEPSPRSSDRAAHDDRNLLERKVEGEVQDDHHAVLMRELAYRPAEVGTPKNSVLARHEGQLRSGSKADTRNPTTQASLPAY